MPAKSIKQQKLFGMALAYKRGELTDVSDEVKKLADSMSEKKLKEFAKTPHKDLPIKKESFDNKINNILKEDPDDIFTNMNAITFVYFTLSELKKFIKDNKHITYSESFGNDEDNIITHMKLLDNFDAFVKKYKISKSKPFLAIALKNKLLINDKKARAITSNTHVGIVCNVLLEIYCINYDKIPERAEINYDFNETDERTAFLCGRAINARNIPDYPEKVGFVSFWRNASFKEIQFCVKSLSKYITFKKPLIIEVPPKEVPNKGNSYGVGTRFKYAEKNNKPKMKLDKSAETDVIDAVRQRRWPNLKFEQIIEAILSDHQV